MKLKIAHRFALSKISLVLINLIPSAYAFAADQESSSAQLGTVVVTGTRASNRTDLESLQPVKVISSTELTASGSSELAEVLSRLVPSLNFPRPASSGFTGVVRPVQMRGLAPDQVLVLINGKRQHTSAFLNTNVTIGRGSAAVDLNTIPVSAIDHVEVLSDGASARYGSDAIAGVINIILKKDDSGGQITSKFGGYKKGDGIQRHVDGDTGISLADKGFLHFSGEANSNDFTSRAGPDLRTAGAPGYGDTTYRVGDPEVKDGKFVVNGEYELSDTLTAYGFGTYSQAHGNTWDSFRNGNASAQDTLAHPGGYRPELHSESEDQSLVLGLKGLLGTWTWDASLDYGRSRFDFYSRDSLNRDLYRDTKNLQSSFNDGNVTSTQTVYQFALSNELNILGLPNPVSVATGIEYQHQLYQEGAGETASYYGTGAQGFSGFRPSESGTWRRDIFGQYLDLETNLTDKWRVSGAARYDRYSDFGGSTTGALSTRYDFTPQVAVRGSVSTGFRAPGLAQQNYSATTSALNTTINAYQDQHTAPVNDPLARLLGSEDLKPEKSRSISAGIVLQPTDDFSATADIYKILINDRITLSSNLNVQNAAAQNYLAANGITPGLYQSVRYFTNAVDTDTTGIDVTGQYRMRFDNGGRLNNTIGYSYNKTRVTDIKANPSVLESNGLALSRIDRRDQYGVLTDSTPRSKISLSNDYSLGDWSFHSNLIRYGSVLGVSNTGPDYDQRYSAKWVLDLSTSYRLEDWVFTVGGDNVINQYPDKRNSLNNPGGQNVKYETSYSPFGANGAFYYLQASYQW